jgi:uncharacterized alkaline shock family protein YloU
MEMKLRIWHRLALLIGALLMVVIGAAILVGSVQFNQIPIRSEGEGFFTITRLVLLIGGAITMIFGFFLLTLPHRMKVGKESFVVSKTDAGEMRISVQAIETIVQKCMSQHEEIKLQNLQVSNAKNGVHISLKALLAGNISIPLAVSAIQKHIRQNLIATTGIDAKEIRINVENTENTIKESPYLVQEEELMLREKPEIKDKQVPEAKKP